MLSEVFEKQMWPWLYLDSVLSPAEAWGAYLDYDNPLLLPATLCLIASAAERKAAK